MPRLRRAARERRQLPQLSEEVWLWLSGVLSYEAMSESGKLSRLILETPVRGHELRDFWNKVRERVETGAIRVDPDAIHRLGDPSLLGESQ
jgi:hypothetical protein